MTKNLIITIKYLAAPALILTILTFISACKDVQEEIPVEVNINQKLNFNPIDYHAQLRDYFSDADSSISVKMKLHYADTLWYAYADRYFEPNFIKSFDEKSFIDSLIFIIKKANEHGLNPEVYHPTIILKEFSKALIDSIPSKNRYEHLAKTELLVCDAILKYSHDIRFGALNPKEIFLDSYFLPIPDSTNRQLFEPFEQESIVKYLHEIQPKNEKYLKLQSALKHFESLENVKWEKLPPKLGNLKFGSMDTSLILVANRLASLGYIDTSEIKISQLTSYDSSFSELIRKYQHANGLRTNGELDKYTQTSLNTKPSDYITKIKINLERLRWIDYSDTSKYILVNIPDFTLYVMENGKELFDIKVCAGRKRTAGFEQRYLNYLENKKKLIKPQDWETPYLYGQISHLILNPVWRVPASIVREEILYKIKKDSTYLSRASFKVYERGKLISPAQIDLENFSNLNLPYSFIQDPGAGNALGKIKFMFDNPFGVYLHDTPTRTPFNYLNRAVSHGCVRVEKPLQLAEFLLDNNSKWTIDYLKIEIGSKVDNSEVVEEYKQKRAALRKNASLGPTTDLELKKSIPVFIDYYTAWIDENGVLNLRDDVYNHDKIVLKNLIAEKQIHSN